MSDKIKGSDGIERTIEEWQEFILERFALHSSKNRDEAWSISRMQSLILIEYAFNETNPLRDGAGRGRKQAMESIDMAMERMDIFFRKALTDALDTKNTVESRWNVLQATMEKFSRQCRPQKDSSTEDKIGQICLLIYEILREDGYLIDSREKLLHRAVNGGCWAKGIELRDVARAVEWCKLDKFCRDNNKPPRG